MIGSVIVIWGCDSVERGVIVIEGCDSDRGV